jgi:hypothetical protein
MFEAKIIDMEVTVPALICALENGAGIFTNPFNWYARIVGRSSIIQVGRT